jgi:hypothetical protein
LARIVERVARSASVTFLRIPPFTAFVALPLAAFGPLFLGPILFPARPECHKDWTDFVLFGGITYMSYEFLTPYTTDRPDPSVLGPDFASVGSKSQAIATIKPRKGTPLICSPAPPFTP